MDETMASPWLHARLTPDKPAIIMADTGETLSYGRMVEGANRLAHLFADLGLEVGDCVAFFAENRARYLELVWAAKSAGLYYVCMARQLSVGDARYILDNSGAKALIASGALLGVAAEAVRGLPRPLHLFAMDGAAEGFAPLDDALSRQPDAELTGRRRGASMLYSSGTTGRPKGVRHALPDVSPHVPPPRHGFMIEVYGFGPDTALLCPGPFYHTGPLRFMMHAQRVGATIIGFAKFDAAATLAAIGAHRVTHGLFVPTMFVRMLALPDAVRAAADLSSLRSALHIAAPISPAVKQRMIDWFGPVIDEMYGGTESNGTTVIGSAEWLAHRGSVGRPVKGCEIHIVDETGAECPPGVPGLVYMSNGKTFEYHDEPDKTAASRHPEGWSTLGDIGHLDADGYLYLTDRASNLIISGGVNIYPQEAEAVLAGHAQVADVAVLGIPDPDFGEQVKALVVCRCPPAAGAALEQELIAFCRAALGAVKSPRSVEFVDALPRSEAGKILRAELRRRHWPEGAGLVV